MPSNNCRSVCMSRKANKMACWDKLHSDVKCSCCLWKPYWYISYIYSVFSEPFLWISILAINLIEVLRFPVRSVITVFDLFYSVSLQNVEKQFPKLFKVNKFASLFILGLEILSTTTPSSLIFIPLVSRAPAVILACQEKAVWSISSVLK